MNKPKFETPDMTQKNIDKIAQLFPNCITESKGENGKLKKAVNFELLQQMLSDDIADKNEAYEFTWVGKNAAIVEANTPIRKALRPCKEESVDWDTTENLYIEGDNLEVLKLLQESYLGKVKMIYIDPPYNTGNDFIYRDDFALSSEEYAEETGLFDEKGNRLFKNTDTNGRFHSDWCSMIYSRLLLARNLLADDGVIFISIDDNEVDNLRKICDEVFGESNFVGLFFRKTKSGGGSAAGTCAVEHDYVLAYSKCSESLTPLQENFTSDYLNRYKEQDENGVYFWDTMERSSTKTIPYVITAPDGTKLTGKWFRSEETFKKDLETGEVRFLKKKDGSWSVQFKQRLADGKKLRTILDEEDLTDKKYRSLTEELENIVGCSLQHPPKSVLLMKTLINSVTLEKNKSEAIILDFFSGSATTAHATMQLNAEDGGKRKFIMVQIPELTDEKSEAYKAGYKNICEIGKERIRRAGKKIKEENSLTTQNLDIGFRVLKVDDSNMKDVYYSASEYEQDKLDMFESNIKDDRTDLDLLFGCLLDWGLPLSLPYTSESLGKFTIHTYNNGDLVACFNEDVSEDVVKEIARKKPLRAVFRDSSFSNSASKINVFEIFKMISPETSVKVI
ncbi:MAG: site-specific DNA-methyltransferase [Treponema sp.]|nr:site-specific DNA-methyltransferase [Treponema sp.]